MIGEGFNVEPRNRRVLIGLLAVMAVILAGWALEATRTVTVPLAFAFFVALLVHPIQRWFAERLPEKLRWIGVAAAMLTIVAVLAAGVGALWLAVQQVVEKGPQYAEQIQQTWRQIVQWAQARNLPIPQGAGQGGELTDRVTGLAIQFLRSLESLVVFLVLAFFFVLLMLLEASQWRAKLRSAFDDRGANVLDAVEAIAVKVRQYLAVRTFISLISAVLEGLWLWLVGVDFAFLWALLFFVLNYVPNVGSILAAIPPTLMALLQFGIGQAALAVGGLVVIEQIIGNFVDPMLQGRRLTVSPVVVLLSVIFWTWLWGVAGAVLAVPMTVTILIICAHVPALHPIALLLSRTADERELMERTHADTRERERRRAAS